MQPDVEKQLQVFESLISPPSTDRLIGTKIGDALVVEQLIGRGGNGSVYRATELLLGRTVALKVLDEDCDATSVKRFMAEARASFDLQSEHICRVHSVGVTLNNRPYIVMDFIDGENLSARIKRQQKLDPDELISLMVQLCTGLETAHAAGFVHRDIKPSNICVDHQGKAVLVDFGIAKHHTVDSTLTGTGEVIGTVDYMSPEQCQGLPIDARSDIYSLGCTMYHLLTGERPFSAETPIAIVMKHLHEAPPMIPERGEKKLQQLRSIICRAMQKDPADRYATAGDLRADLLLVLGGGKVKNSRRAKLPGWKGAVGAAAALLMLATLYWMSAYGGGFDYSIQHRPDGSTHFVGTQTEKSADETLAADPNDQHALAVKAAYLLQKGERIAGRKIINKALLLSPNDVDSLNNLLRLQLDQQDLGGSIDTVRRLVVLSPESKAHWLAISQLAWNMSRYQQMQDAARQAVLFNPKLDQAWFFLALSSRRQGNNEEAANCLAKACELSPSWAKAYDPAFKQMLHNR